MRPKGKLDASTKRHLEYDLAAGSALAQAQAMIQNVIDTSGLSKAEVSRRLGRGHFYIGLILQGDHDLTVRELAYALKVCGFNLELDYVRPMPARQGPGMIITSAIIGDGKFEASGGDGGSAGAGGDGGSGGQRAGEVPEICHKQKREARK